MTSRKVVVLISPDSSKRTSLKSRLLGGGAQVSAFRSAEDARRWIYLGGRVPALVVVDIWRRSPDRREIQGLRDLSDRSPVIFLAGARDRIPPELESVGEVLRNPISIAKILERVEASRT